MYTTAEKLAELRNAYIRVADGDPWRCVIEVGGVRDVYDASGSSILHQRFSHARGDLAASFCDSDVAAFVTIAHNEWPSILEALEAVRAARLPDGAVRAANLGILRSHADSLRCGSGERVVREEIDFAIQEINAWRQSSAASMKTEPGEANLFSLEVGEAYLSRSGNPESRACGHAVKTAIEELKRLRSIVAQHNLCHDQHGKVNAEDFANSCIAEQKKIYGRSPTEELSEGLRKEAKIFRDELEKVQLVMRENNIKPPGMLTDTANYLQSGLKQKQGEILVTKEKARKDRANLVKEIRNAGHAAKSLSDELIAIGECIVDG